MNLKIEKLSSKHLPLVDAFFCTEESAELQHCNSKERRRIIKHSKEMEDFLKEEALKEQEKGLNTTHLFIDKDSKKIVAYLSLCNDSIRLEFDERDGMNLSYATIPAVKIARLAVSNDYKHQGMGKKLIQFTAFIGKNIRNVSGLTFITLDCYEHRVSFYEAIGFVRNVIQPIVLPYDSPISMRLGLDSYLEKIDEDIV